MHANFTPKYSLCSSEDCFSEKQYGKQLDQGKINQHILQSTVINVLNGDIILILVSIPLSLPSESSLSSQDSSESSSDKSLFAQFCKRQGMQECSDGYLQGTDVLELWILF